jgi:hypothetical protein
MRIAMNRQPYCLGKAKTPGLGVFAVSAEESGITPQSYL